MNLGGLLTILTDRFPPVLPSFSLLSLTCILYNKIRIGIFMQISKAVTLYEENVCFCHTSVSFICFILSFPLGFFSRSGLIFQVFSLWYSWVRTGRHIQMHAHRFSHIFCFCLLKHIFIVFIKSCFSQVFAVQSLSGVWGFWFGFFNGEIFVQCCTLPCCDFQWTSMDFYGLYFRSVSF